MRRFLVEIYVPRARARDGSSARCARSAAGQLTREGTPVRYVRSTLLPEDETCYHVFEAQSEAAIVAVIRRAGFGSARIVRAVE